MCDYIAVFGAFIHYKQKIFLDKACEITKMMRDEVMKGGKKRRRGTVSVPHRAREGHITLTQREQGFK